MSMHMVGAILWGAIGTACVVRGFFRPFRAVVRKGAIVRCAGAQNAYGTCDPVDTIETDVGEPVYSVGPAKVVEVGPYYVHLAIQNDAVVVMYEGLEPLVEVGQHVGTGQKIGESDGKVSIIVSQFKPNNVVEYVPPSAWLAVRGLKLVLENEGSDDLYCSGGREIVVPNEYKRNCDLKSPRKAKFALLPVTVELQ